MYNLSFFFFDFWLATTKLPRKKNKNNEQCTSIFEKLKRYIV